MGAIGIMESKILKTKGPTDVLIQPQVGMYATLEFTKALEIIKRGEDAARQQVSTLQRFPAPRPRRAHA